EPADETAVDGLVPVPAPGRGETVLVADDEPGVRELARTVLDRQGYRVLVAADGAEAVEVFRHEPGQVDLVVLDASMPNMNGRQAFESIRGIRPGVPVLFASGYPSGQLLPEEPAPGTAFLNKPFTTTELATAVRQLLDEHTPTGRET
ncbi:MAG TPA: response regulator, partial [Gemmataceae bacterium]|nr:response regulator [Gemmataceae bacterium]